MKGVPLPIQLDLNFSRRTMTPVAPPSPSAEKIADLIDFLARLFGSVGAFWLAIQGVIKPYITWRRESIRAVLKPELEQITALVKRQENCAQSNEDLNTRVNQAFNEFDTMLMIMLDNRDRIDEQNELLDRVFGLDRRIAGERREQIDAMLNGLAQRRKEARRAGDPHPLSE